MGPKAKLWIIIGHTKLLLSLIFFTPLVVLNELKKNNNLKNRMYSLIQKPRPVYNSGLSPYSLLFLLS